MSLIFISMTNNVFASVNGWVHGYYPKYSNNWYSSHVVSREDPWGSDIFYKLRNSYTYNTRMPKINGAAWVQPLMYETADQTETGLARYWTNITYSNNTPNGEMGYTEWYDSPHGLVLDYLGRYAQGTGNPINGEYVSYDVVKDMIDYNSVMHGNKSSAYIASTDGEVLSDAKSASALGRDDGSRNFPIYINNGLDLEQRVINALDSKGVKNLYVMGGYKRFNYTAGVSKGFNIIRAGGINSQETYEFYKNLPTKMSNPDSYTGDSNGIVISGNLPGGLTRDYVWKELNNYKNSGNISTLTNLAETVSNRGNIGSKPYKSQSPVLILGVNTPNFKSYWICYYNNTDGTYVYQFILPQYFSNNSNPAPTDNGLTVKKYDYKQNDSTFWVKKGNEFQVETNGYFAQSVGDYPTRSYLRLAVDGKSDSNSPRSYGETSKNGTLGDFSTHFALYDSSNRATRSNADSRNYLKYIHSLKGKKDLEEYKLYSNTSYLMNGTEYNGSWKDSGKWIKIDGENPTIEGGQSAGWRNTNFTISASASDGKGSGMDSITLYNSSGTSVKSETSSLSYEVSSEGTHTYSIEAVDNVKNSSSKTVTVKIDKTNPSGAFTPNSSSWRNSNLSVSFNPSDTGGSGVYRWRYRQSSNNGSTWGAWSSYINGDTTSNITVSAESSSNKIQAEIYDNAGNKGTVTSGIYKIDKTNPGGVFTPNSSDWRNSNLTVSFNPSDNLSGVSKWRYRQSSNNGSTWSAWSSYINGDTTSNITVSAESDSNKIQAEIIDNAGNIGTVTSGIYKIDKTAPTATSYNVVDRQDDTFTIDIVGVTDGSGSGVKSQTVKVWIDTPSGRKEKTYTPTTVNSTTSRVVVNRLDYGGYTKTYYYDLTLVDNVGNSRTYTSKTATMIQNNLTAKRIDIYDPREKRYVSQVISGLQYEAVVEVENNGERAISKNFDIGFKIDGTQSGVFTETNGIAKGVTKEYKFTFTAGEENLKGVKYEGIADYNDYVYETNENDNIAATKNPYSTPRSEENPPIIPPDITTGNKPSDPVPIITVIVDLEADYIDIVELNSELSVTEVITDDEYRIKYRVKNNSSFSLRYLDILSKTFNNKVYYDGVLNGQVNLSDMNKGEVKTFYQNFKVPLLPDGIVEDIKAVRLDVDTTNSIKESNEINNIISRNKKIIGLKVMDYRITDVVNPINSLTFPIYTNEMPLRVKAGYNVTFKVNVLGKPDKVYSKIKDSTGKDYGIFEMEKVKDIDSVRSEWTYTFAPNVDTPDNTIVITQIYADRNSFTYDYNLKESWNGHTLKIGGSAKDDIIIYRKY